MNRSNQQLPCLTISFLLLIGVSAIAGAFWLVDHRQAASNSDVLIAVFAGLFFVFFTLAVLRFLHWRDQHRMGRMHELYSPDPKLAGTIYGMTPGLEYRVVKSFTDHDGNAFERGERLHFQHRQFLPYHGGHTIVFESRVLYLQEEQNSDILDRFSEYIALIEQ